MYGQGYYALGNGALVQAESSESDLSSFRWYMAVTDRFGNPKNVGEVKLALFTGDGETDGIQVTRDQRSAATAAIYDMGGRRISIPTRGMYVRNGKKFIVK